MSDLGPIEVAWGFKRLLSLTLREEGSWLRESHPDELGSSKLAILLDGRLLSTCDYWWPGAKRLLETRFFSDTVNLGFYADKRPGRSAGLLSVRLLAGPASMHQYRFLQELYEAGDGKTRSIWRIPKEPIDLLALWLGELWLAVPPRVLDSIAEDSPTFKADVLAWADATDALFAAFLEGEIEPAPSPPAEPAPFPRAL